MSRRIVFSRDTIRVAAPSEDATTAAIGGLYFDASKSCVPVFKRGYVDVVESPYQTYTFYFGKTFSEPPAYTAIFSPTGAPWSQPLAARSLIFSRPFNGSGETIVYTDQDAYGYMYMRLNAYTNRITLETTSYVESEDDTEIQRWSGFVIFIVYDFSLEA